jgi:magnesium transporter
MLQKKKEHFLESVMSHVRKDFIALRAELTIEAALAQIRGRGEGGGEIVYFYVVDEAERLVGVVPARRLLSAPLDRRLTEVMLGRVISIPHSATLMDACEMFALHKLLALPVVDEQRRPVGLVEVGVFADEVFDIAEKKHIDEVFEALGFRVSQVRDASPARAFRFRFPWLAATLGSGTVCAMLAGAYEATLAQTLILAFFLTLILGLGESVSIQSMTVTIQSLRTVRPTRRWYLRALWRELGTALLLGAACGATVGLVAWLWRGTFAEAAVIGVSILPVLCSACFFGLSVPALLHVLRLDPKIAAGPIALALTDVFTLLFYFSLAAMIL